MFLNFIYGNLITFPHLLPLLIFASFLKSQSPSLGKLILGEKEKKGTGSIQFTWIYYIKESKESETIAVQSSRLGSFKGKKIMSRRLELRFFTQKK